NVTEGGRRVEPRETSHGLPAATGDVFADLVVVKQSVQLHGEALGGPRWKKYRGTAQCLAVRGYVAEQKRGAARGSFHRRKPESLGQRGNHDRPCAGVEPSERFIGNEARKKDVRFQAQRGDLGPDGRDRRDEGFSLEVANSD